MEPQTAAPSPPAQKQRHPVITALLIVLAAFFVFLIALVGFIAAQPAEFRLERSLKMAAPPETVFAEVNDLHKWEAWSPWVKLDPDAKTTYSGSESGEGAQFAWDGNDEMGAGQMTIVESRPNELVRMKLDFTRPMENSCDVTFSFTPDADGTRVTWAMAGPNNFIGKALQLVIDMDAMVGAQFEEGLTNLQHIVEEKPAQ